MGALLRVGFGAAVLLLLISCDSVRYYGQAARGQISLLLARQDIATLLTDNALDAQTRDKLALVLQARDFAQSDLHLSPGDSYRRFVALERPFVLWNVFAAPEFSISPLTWCYPVAGCVSYRGYFSEEGAERYAQTLRQKQLDVYSGPVDAYSTLGWFDDPLTSAVLRRSDQRLIALVFHELAHRQVYLPGDTTFNESFATFVEQEGLRRWSALHPLPDGEATLVREAEIETAFVALIADYRAQFADLYASDLAPADMREQKQALQQALRSDYEKARDAWGYRGYDRWFEGPLNNAQLSTVAAYNDLVPAFARLLEEAEGDLETFYARVSAIAQMPADARERLLAQARFHATHQVAIEL